MENNKSDFTDEYIINHGRLLSEAFYDFAPAWMRREFDAQWEFNQGEARKGPTAEEFQGLRTEDKIRATASQLGKVLKSIFEPEISTEMKRHVLALLAGNKLNAFGVSEDPESSEHYTRIPITRLEPQFIKWSRDEIEGRAFLYRSVRLIKLSAAKPPTHLKPVKPNKREAGSDKRKQLTIEVYRALMDTLPKKRTKTLVCKEVIKVLEQRYAEHFPGGRGLDYDTLCRHLSGQPGF